MGPLFFSGGTEQPQREMMVPQFYSGARDSKDAAPVMLRGGDVLTGIDFHLTAQHPVTISGRVTGVPRWIRPADALLTQPGARAAAPHDSGATIQSVTVSRSSPAEDDMPCFSGPAALAQWLRTSTLKCPAKFQGVIESKPSSSAPKDKSYYASQLVDAHSRRRQRDCAGDEPVGGGERPSESGRTRGQSRGRFHGHAGRRRTGASGKLFVAGQRRTAASRSRVFPPASGSWA